MAATKEKQEIIKAINQLGRRVTAADVAESTGLPVLRVTKELNDIAAETDGHLEVAESGDIAYKYVSGFQARYLATGLRKVLQQIWSKTFAVGFFLVRISFGVMLIVSLLLVVVLIIAVIIGMRGGGDRDRGLGSIFGGDHHHHGFHLSFFDYLILRDLLYWGTYSATRPRQRSLTYRDDTPTIRRPENKGNFLFNCFSFLFGDGNPNLNLEDRKWSMIASVIRSSKGVVTAEQLAPYITSEASDEDAVLPVLVRFDGRPEVTDSGNIVYVFPGMQVTAGNENLEKDLPAFLKEWEIKFSNVSPGDMVPVYVVAGLNFFGSWILVGQMLGGEIPLLMALSPLVWSLAIYGTLFLAVPLARFIVLNFINSRIESRNNKRQDAALRLSNASGELLVKLNESLSYRSNARVLTSGQAVYSTERDLLEQEFDV